MVWLGRHPGLGVSGAIATLRGHSTSWGGPQPGRLVVPIGVGWIYYQGPQAVREQFSSPCRDDGRWPFQLLLGLVQPITGERFTGEAAEGKRIGRRRMTGELTRESVPARQPAPQRSLRRSIGGGKRDVVIKACMGGV